MKKRVDLKNNRGLSILLTFVAIIFVTFVIFYRYKNEKQYAYPVLQIIKPVFFIFFQVREKGMFIIHFLYLLLL